MMHQYFGAKSPSREHRTVENATRHDGSFLMSWWDATFRSVLWNFVEQLLRKGLSAASTLVLSYFLVPADFGLIAYLSLFLMLGTSLMDSGLKEALVRRRHLSPRLLDTAFWASLVTGLIAYFCLFFLAPHAAEFFAQPDLIGLVRAGGLAIIINAIQLPVSARLMQKLDFKALAKSTFPAAALSSLLAVVLAYVGLGVWSLVAQTLVGALVSTYLMWRVAGWSISVRIDIKPLRELYIFGHRLFFSALISTVVRNAAPAVLGKFLGATLAGYYYFVDKIMEMVMGQLVYSVQNVTYPAFSKIRHQPKYLKSKYRIVIAVSVFAICPLLTIAAGLSDELFRCFFPEQWRPAASCFRWLCVVFTMYPLHAINLNIIKVMGRSDWFLRLEIIKAITSLGILAFSISYGLDGVLLGQVLTTLICYVPNAFYTRQLIGYPVTEQLQDVLPYYLAAALSGTVAWSIAFYLEGRNDILIIVVGTLLASILYLALCKLMRLEALTVVLETTRTIKLPPRNE